MCNRNLVSFNVWTAVMDLTFSSPIHCSDALWFTPGLVGLGCRLSLNISGILSHLH